MAVFEPAAGEAGALETRARVPIAAHHAPDQIAPIVLDHRQDRPLVDADVVRIHPTRVAFAPLLVRGGEACVEGIAKTVRRVDRS
jgi:hypothetical protein